MWFSGLDSTASDDADAYGESARRTSELVRERTSSIDERDAAPSDWMSDCARERAASERDVPEFVRERECDAEWELVREREAPEPERENSKRKKKLEERSHLAPLEQHREIDEDARGFSDDDEFYYGPK